MIPGGMGMGGYGGGDIMGMMGGMGGGDMMAMVPHADAHGELWRRRPPRAAGEAQVTAVIPGRCEASNLRCAIAHRGISRTLLDHLVGAGEERW
jgi:hypothetical protein